jgi:tetratricopeptide (TPR) repeat protein
MLKRIDALDESVGGDPYLDLYRGNALLAMGKRDEARKAYERLYAWRPSLGIEHAALVHMLFDDKDFARAAEVLTSLDANPDINYSVFSRHPQYSTFIETPEGKRWLESDSSD